MGREVRRVALDFEHPIRERWSGFVNPHYLECPAHCGGGYSEEYRFLEPHVRTLLRDAEKKGGAALKIATALAEREPFPFGFEGMATYVTTEKILALAGALLTCPVCGGSGVDPKIQSVYDAWVPTPPPPGDGWQMWETTSEGSPISPVFSTPEDLAHWLSNSRASSFGDDTATYEQWLGMIQGPGWALDLVIQDDRLMTGIALAASQSETGKTT
ncbi:MAG: hypothetical protein Q8R92_07220 [Deltaproteobacteria bacterium]|nr:hypothetical protein [Deltaproteobacteria bacterium]